MKSLSLKIHQFGSPADVLELSDDEIPPPAENEVLVEMLYASINPADINLIEGTYGIKPALPATPGNEGVGKILQLGANVKNFSAGDFVRPLNEGTGLWRKHLLISEDNLLRLPNHIPPEQAAMLYVNPPTAWRMMHDFVTLEKGDWLIQNAGNSAVGQCAVQIAKHKGWKTINIVRRPESAELLKSLGADIVLLDDDSLKQNLASAVKDKKIRLALNAVGGDSALNIAGTLTNGGTCVTYGAMSKQALKIPNAFLIFKDIRFTGFWMTRWYRSASLQQKESLFSDLAQLIADGSLKINIEKIYPLEEFRSALSHVQQPSRDGKILFQML